MNQKTALRQTFDKITKKIIEEYMNDNGVLRIEIDFKNNTVLVLEPISSEEKGFLTELWINNEISTRQLRIYMKKQYQWTQYFLKDFLNEVLNYD